jgi:hypothetical protein
MVKREDSVNRRSESHLRYITPAAVLSEKLGDDNEAIPTCAAGDERRIANLLRGNNLAGFDGV